MSTRDRDGQLHCDFLLHADRQQRQAASFRKPSVTCSTAGLEYSDLDKQEAAAPLPPQTLSPSPPFHNRIEYLKISLNGTSPRTKRWKSSSLPLSILPGAKEKRQMSVFISAKRSQRGCKPLLIQR